MNTSSFISSGIRKSARAVLKCNAQYHWKRYAQFSAVFTSPRQIWTSAAHLKFPARCRSASKPVTNSFNRVTSAETLTSKVPQMKNLFHTYRQVHLNASISSRSLSTTNANFDQFQKQENPKIDANTENGLLESKTGSSSTEEQKSSSENPLEVDEYLSRDQWIAQKEEWKQNAGRYQAQEVFESRTMARLCSSLLFQKGRSLMEFVRQEGIPLTYPLMSSYLFLCIREGDHKELFQIHDWFMANHTVLNEGVLTNLIAGFCQTDRWRESLSFLESIKQIGVPSSRNYHSLISTACDHCDYDLVEELLQDMYSHGTSPSEQTCIKLLQTFHCETDDATFYDRSDKLASGLLGYMRTKRIYPSVVVGSELQNWFHRKKGEVWKASMTRVTKSGKCRFCSARLESLDISPEEFSNLQYQITEKVIKAGDIFKKTRPDELEAFMDFVDKGCPYDVIVDGLNVAYIRSNVQPSKMLRQFVVYLAQECGLKTLVLGRQHMLQYSKSWNKHHMDAIRDVADCFFTENVSEDDPFMLYATLHSGPKACYVSRDMLRDHKALLDQPTHVSFIKWQRGHQMYPLGFQGRKAVFKERIAHDTVAQCSNSSWHIPCDDGSPRYSYQVPLDWLCARKVK